MSQSISTWIVPPSGLTLAASATANVDVRLTDIADMRVMLTQSWVTTGSPTGMSVNLYPGVGGIDPAEIAHYPLPTVVSNPASAGLSTVPIFANNYAPIITTAGTNALVQPTPSSNNQVTRTLFYLNSIITIWPQWIRVQLINLDSSNPVVVGLAADI